MFGCAGPSTERLGHSFACEGSLPQQPPPPGSQMADWLGGAAVKPNYGSEPTCLPADYIGGNGDSQPSWSQGAGHIGGGYACGNGCGACAGNGGSEASFGAGQKYARAHLHRSTRARPPHTFLSVAGNRLATQSGHPPHSMGTSPPETFLAAWLPRRWPHRDARSPHPHRLPPHHPLTLARAL